MTHDTDEVHLRVARLESRLERTRLSMRCLLLTMGMGIAAIVLVAAKQPTTYQASAFQLVADDGTVRGELVLEEGEPLLHLNDENGSHRVSLFHHAAASGLYVKDAEAVTRIGVAQFSHGGGGVALHGPGSKGAAVLYLKENGSLRFFDAEGAVIKEVVADDAAGSDR